MDKIKEFHEKAMDIVEKAYMFKRCGDMYNAFLMFEEALALESNAAYLFDKQYSEEPSRSIFFRSAASIAMKCYKLDQSEAFIDEAFSGKPTKKEIVNLNAIKKTLNDVMSLMRYNDVLFCEYLIIGIECLENEGVKAFYPLDGYLSDDGDFVKCFCFMYDHLSPRVRYDFKKGLVKAIHQIDLNRMSYIIVVDLLRILEYIDAFIFIEVIVKRFFTGEGAVCSEIKKAEYVRDVAINTIKSMMTKNPIIGTEYIKSVIMSNNFKSHNALIAFIALCRVEPKRYVDHLKLLRMYIIDAKKENDMLFIDESSEIIKEFSQCVNVEVIAKGLSEIKLSTVDNAGPELCDNWFIDKLFCGHCSPLKIIINSSNVLSICLREGAHFDFDISCPDDAQKNFTLYRYLKNILYKNEDEDIEFHRDKVDVGGIRLLVEDVNYRI